MKIAILGGGVAGVSNAIALKQAGFDVSVYERHKSASNIGAGIVVWPNAAYVLEQLGVLDEIKAVSGNPIRMQRISNTNDDLGAVDIELINHHMGYPSLSILRKDFQNILISKLESCGVEIQYGKKIIDIETKSHGQALVCLENGTKINADVVIGADGRMASQARLYVNEDNSPVYQQFINWIGVYESKEALFDEVVVSDYWGVGERFGVVPITKHKAYWAGGIACSDIGSRNPAEYKAELLAVFSKWPAIVGEIIDRTSVESINKIYVHDHDPIRTWHKDNLIMVGDAAHAPLPTSGQGACQALEDAYHLAHCLVESPNDIQHAFSRFTDMRFEKTTNIIMAARGFAASLFNRNEDFCKTRNENSKRSDFSKMAAAMSRGWAQGLPLYVQQGI